MEKKKQVCDDGYQAEKSLKERMVVCGYLGKTTLTISFFRLFPSLGLAEMSWVAYWRSSAGSSGPSSAVFGLVGREQFVLARSSVRPACEGAQPRQVMSTLISGPSTIVRLPVVVEAEIPQFHEKGESPRALLSVGQEPDGGLRVPIEVGPAITIR